MSDDYKTINVGALAAGSYILTLTATDSSGLAGTATITIIATAAEGVVAPLITFSKSSYDVHSMGDRIPYTVTGTDPKVSIQVNGGVDTRFKLDELEKMIVISPGVDVGEYNVTVTAKNSAGVSSVSIVIFIVIG